MAPMIKFADPPPPHSLILNKHFITLQFRLFTELWSVPLTVEKNPNVSQIYSLTQGLIDLVELINIRSLTLKLSHEKEIGKIRQRKEVRICCLPLTSED